MSNLALNPPHKLSGFRGPPDTLSGMVRAIQGPRGERSMLVRSLTEQAVGKLWPKDYLGEILAINAWVSERVIYLNDPLHVELLKDPQRLGEEILAKGFARGDCDDIAAMMATMGLQVGRDAQLACVGFGAKGQYSHVFARLKAPRTNTWIVCDPVAGSGVASMLNRVTTFEIWSCDESPDHGPVEAR